MNFTVSGNNPCCLVQARDETVGDYVVAIFYGPYADERANAYAAWMNQPREVGEQLYAIREEMKTLSFALANLRQLTAVKL